MQIFFFFFFARKLHCVWKPEAGHKDIKVGCNDKKHMQIFHINNSQLSTGAMAPCLGLPQVAICLALLKGMESPSSDVLFCSCTCFMDWM